MKTHEFFGKYANVPLNDRLRIMDMSSLGLTTLNTVWKEVHDLEEQIHPLRLRQEKLIASVEKFVLEHQAMESHVIDPELDIDSDEEFPGAKQVEIIQHASHYPDVHLYTPMDNVTIVPNGAIEKLMKRGSTSSESHTEEEG